MTRLGRVDEARDYLVVGDRQWSCSPENGQAESGKGSNLVALDNADSFCGLGRGGSQQWVWTMEGQMTRSRRLETG